MKKEPSKYDLIEGPSLYDLVHEKNRIKKAGGDLTEINEKIAAMERKAKSGEPILLIGCRR